MILHATAMGQGESLVLLHGLFGAARNFGAVQRRLAYGQSSQMRRVIALDLRNHGASPHDGDMRYATMAADVLETLEKISALPATLLGHSMGGKVAMQAALLHPETVARLIVADIAPAAYPPHHQATVTAMARLPMSRGLSRAEADAALADAVPDAAVRAFLLQNLRPGATPHWQIGLAEILAALPVIEEWDAPTDASYTGPALFIAGAASDYIRPDHRPIIRSLFPAARFVTLKNAGHWLHAENPDGFIGVVEAFLTATA